MFAKLERRNEANDRSQIQLLKKRAVKVSFVFSKDKLDKDPRSLERRSKHPSRVFWTKPDQCVTFIPSRADGKVQLTSAFYLKVEFNDRLSNAQLTFLNNESVKVDEGQIPSKRPATWTCSCNYLSTESSNIHQKPGKPQTLEYLLNWKGFPYMPPPHSDFLSSTVYPSSLARRLGGLENGKENTLEKHQCSASRFLLARSVSFPA